MRRLIANARMYSVAPGAAAAWRALLADVAQVAQVPLEIIDYPAPQPLEMLWARDDLACTQMCGWPFAEHAKRPIAIAAPIPSPARYGGRPVYFSDLIVREDAPFARLEDTFGGRLAWTVGHSHSGFNALRHHLMRYRTRERPSLYARTVGPLVTARRIVEAVIAGEADVGPLDSYWHDLLRVHEPATVAKLRVIATTEPAPIPLFVASAGADRAMTSCIAAALVDAPRRAIWRAVAEPLLLAGFAPVDGAEYGVASGWARAARGYLEPGWPDS
jgi:ABC-type phosphate/phosphonate transport system substrate-binding protein